MLLSIGVISKLVVSVRDFQWKPKDGKLLASDAWESVGGECVFDIPRPVVASNRTKAQTIIHESHPGFYRCEDFLCLDHMGIFV